MSVNTSWANRGKQAIAAAPTRVMKSVGGSGGSLEKILFYYRFNEPKTPSPLARVLNSGDVVEGTYEGTYVDKYEKNNHKVKTAEGLISLPDCSRLNNAFGKIAKGADVRLEYNGKTEITSGPGIGKSAHSFNVTASETLD